MGQNVKSFRVASLEVPKVDHASFGGSSAYTWLNCTGWHDLLSSLPSVPASVGMATAAREGSACHLIMEELAIAHTPTVKRYSGKAALPKEYSNPDLQPINFLECRVFFEGQPDSEAILVTPEMIEYVTWVFHNTLPIIEYADKVFIERKVYLNRKDYGEQAFGYVDIAALRRMANGCCRLTVADYKFGFVRVNVDSPQLLYYGAAMLRELQRIMIENHGVNEAMEGIECILLQPKLFSYSTQFYSMQEITDFLAKAETAVFAALSGLGTLSTGNHCKYCKAASHCPELRDKMLSFPEAPTVGAAGLTPAELSHMMQRANVARIGAARFEAFCMEHIRQGGEIPGYKVVRTKNSVAWKSKKQAELALLKAGVDPDLIYKDAIRTPTELLKISGGAKVDLTQLTHNVIQEQLAPVEDRREAVMPSSVAEGFPDWEPDEQ